MIKKEESKPKPKKPENNYTAKDIFVLEGLEPVRKRPGMYIGSTGVDGLHHLIWEVVDNSLDEAMGGYAKNIDLTLLPEGRVRVSDDGRGIPVETHKQTGKSALETVMTTLHAGGKFGGESYKVAAGLHGVGVSVVNALSIYLKAEICRDGALYEQEYSKGKPKRTVKKVGKCKKNGTTITFEPDPEIFKEIQYDWHTILTHLRQQAYLTKGIRITIKDEREALNPESKLCNGNSNHVVAPSHTFYFDGGIVSYVKFLNHHSEPKHANIFYISKEAENMIVEVAFQYTDHIQGHELSFANNVHTIEGGSHLTGFRSAITRTFNDYAKKNGFLKDKKDENLTGEDIREGLTSIVSVRLGEAQFEGQTKAKLGNPEARTAVESIINTELADWLERHPQDAKEILGQVIIASKARIAARAARETVIRKGALEGFTLPGKLADCSSRKADESEIFIVEGDSAGGCFSGDTKVTLTDGRDITFKQLVEEFKEGRQNYCYTVDKNGNIAIAPIKYPRITKKRTKVIKVTLDNGEEIKCTPNHKFMLRDGSYKEAQYLVKQDSLMPLYKQLSKREGWMTITGYELVFDPTKTRWVYTHVLADKYNIRRGLYNEATNSHRHHKDFKKLNNNPDNIIRLQKEDHLTLHRKHADKYLHTPEILEKLKRLRRTPNFRKRMQEKMLTMKDELSKRAKEQWKSTEYKKYMGEKFLTFYNSNTAYREKSTKRLNEEQQKYWNNLDNRKVQAERIRNFFWDNPHRKEWLSDLSIKQWDDKELRAWRSKKTKKQWTNAFRKKRKIAYDQTYRRKALSLLHDIYKAKGFMDTQRYEELRPILNDKSVLRYNTILGRFFEGDQNKLHDAVVKFNHKIVSVENVREKMDVYDIEVPETHNFALANGVFVHNSAKQGRNRRFQAILPLRGKVLNVERARIDKMLAHAEIRALVIAMGTAIAEEFDIGKLRYHKIIIMTDADVDGAHIRTLLLTLFYRYFPKLIEQGYLYIAQPPLYRIEKNRKITYVYTEEEKLRVLKTLEKEAPSTEPDKKSATAKGKTSKTKDGWEVSSLDEDDDAKADGTEQATEATEEIKVTGVSIQRYKGLGEMNADQLWETTMDPDQRTLLQVTIKDAEAADNVFDVLMGSDVLPRKKFIQSHAKSVKNLDI
ncbi:MAG: DNA topoisomerase (ATP-hydrolyzing) subunit B [Parcubacteria group bacterium]